MSDEKVKEAPKIKIPEQIKEDVRPRKDGPSPFDKVLEKNRLLQESPRQTASQAETTKGGDQVETRVTRHQEGEERGKDRQSDDKEKETGKQKAKESRESGADVGPKIIGKRAKKDSQGQGSGQQGRGKGYGAPMQSGVDLKTKKGEFTKAAQVAAEGAHFADQLKTKMQTAHLSKEYVQDIVNQMVKLLRSGLNKEGEHEVRLDLHERIFRGLRLRVALKDGKVSVHFGTSGGEVKTLFANSSDNIRKELEAKGISVREIKVT